jgi:hypothetical protein
MGLAPGSCHSGSQKAEAHKFKPRVIFLPHAPSLRYSIDIPALAFQKLEGRRFLYQIHDRDLAMQHTGPVYSALICIVLAATIGLSLLLSQPAKADLWWQAKVEGQMARVITISLVLVGGILAIVFG